MFNDTYTKKNIKNTWIEKQAFCYLLQLKDLKTTIAVLIHVNFDYCAEILLCNSEWCRMSVTQQGFVQFFSKFNEIDEWICVLDGRTKRYEKFDHDGYWTNSSMSW